MKLITVPIDEEVVKRLQSAAAAECRPVRYQAAAELRRALGLSVTAPVHEEAPAVPAAPSSYIRTLGRMWWYVYFVPMVPLRVVDYVTCMSCEQDWRAAVLLAEAALLTLLASD